jgi:hypothetical protein
LTTTNFDVFWEAELYRQKGELVRRSGARGPGSQEGAHKAKGKGQKAKIIDPQFLTLDPRGEAEACFLRAIEIARQQEAKLLELRAVRSLARLWQQQGKKQEARQRLAEIYHWFTEGLGTRDLQEAKTLLAELA